MANFGFTAAVAGRMDALAELVANGSSIKDAAISLGITKGEAANAWRNVKNGLGRQAA